MNVTGMYTTPPPCVLACTYSFVCFIYLCVHELEKETQREKQTDSVKEGLREPTCCAAASQMMKISPLHKYSKKVVNDDAILEDHHT